MHSFVQDRQIFSSASSVDEIDDATISVIFRAISVIRTRAFTAIMLLKRKLGLSKLSMKLSGVLASSVTVNPNDFINIPFKFSYILCPGIRLQFRPHRQLISGDNDNIILLRGPEIVNGGDSEQNVIDGMLAVINTGSTPHTIKWEVEMIIDNV